MRAFGAVGLGMVLSDEQYNSSTYVGEDDNRYWKPEIASLINAQINTIACPGIETILYRGKEYRKYYFSRDASAPNNQICNTKLRQDLVDEGMLVWADQFAPWPSVSYFNCYGLPVGSGLMVPFDLIGSVRGAFLPGKPGSAPKKEVKFSLPSLVQQDGNQVATQASVATKNWPLTIGLMAVAGVMFYYAFRGQKR